MQKIADLRPNPQNPRKISDQKLEMLKRSLVEFGDLSGIVYNRLTDRLVGGHQRVKAFDESNTPVIITDEFDTATASGTIAHGYVVIDGERYTYREVIWAEEKEKAANIAANQHGGEWDYPLLSEWMMQLDHSNYDLSLTGFDEKELEKLLASSGYGDGEGAEKDKTLPTEPGKQWIVACYFEGELQMKKFYEEMAEREVTCKLIT